MNLCIKCKTETKNEVPAPRYRGGIFCWRSLQLPRPNRLDSSVPSGLAQPAVSAQWLTIIKVESRPGLEPGT